MVPANLLVPPRRTLRHSPQPPRGAPPGQIAPTTPTDPVDRRKAGCLVLQKLRPSFGDPPDRDSRSSGPAPTQVPQVRSALDHVREGRSGTSRESGNRYRQRPKAAKPRSG